MPDAERDISADLADQVDHALRRLRQGDTTELERLLDSDVSGDLGLRELFRGAFDPPEVSVAGLADQSSVPGYRIIREIGRGGMGVVYEAEQQEPRRRVALKLQRGLAPDEYHLKLFRREIQTLARLKHPAIATIYEAGQTEDGQHFFTMELINGAPLNVHPREAQTPLRARLELFLKICAAVNYAHQRGVIHRDLKPSNILVDAAGSPKILDFGLARITDADVMATTITTEPGKIIGTLPYMSPEQAQGQPERIDVRSDVYSLGVILYELLTGQLPYDLRKVKPHEVTRVILEQPPCKPSVIERSVRGDVETVVLKALEKEPNRRYQSATALADDIGRYLRGEPIEAKGDSAWYVLRTQLRRHRAPAMGVAFVLVGSVLAALVASTGWRRAAENAAQLQTTAEQLDFALRATSIDQCDELARRARAAGDVALAERYGQLSRDLRQSRPSPTAAPTLQVNLHRGKFARPVGAVGLTADSARYNDDARVHAKLPEPAYCYLIALNADGSVQLCHPEDETEPPPKTDDLVFPAGEPDKEWYFGLTDGVGLQGFVLVVSQEPLPPYEQWQSRIGALPWQPVEAEGVWHFDGERFVAQDSERGIVRERPGPPKPFAAVCQHLRDTPGVDAIQAIAFPVEPADAPPRRDVPTGDEKSQGPGR